MSAARSQPASEQQEFEAVFYGFGTGLNETRTTVTFRAENEAAALAWVRREYPDAQDIAVWPADPLHPGARRL